MGGTRQLLCAAGATVDARDAHGNTPLGRATFASQGRPEVIEALPRHGADRNARNDAGVSPQELAERIGNYDVARYFDL